MVLETIVTFESKFRCQYQILSTGVRISVVDSVREIILDFACLWCLTPLSTIVQLRRGGIILEDTYFHIYPVPLPYRLSIKLTTFVCQIVV
jgi:hypothetical protein